MLIQDQCTWVLILHLVHLADGLKRERENTINLVYVPVADVLPSDETDEEADGSADEQAADLAASFANSDADPNGRAVATGSWRSWPWPWRPQQHATEDLAPMVGPSDETTRDGLAQCET